MEKLANHDIELIQLDAIKLPIDLDGKIIKLWDLDPSKRDKAGKSICDLHLTSNRRYPKKNQ
jgi:hypothetical protein